MSSPADPYLAAVAPRGWGHVCAKCAETIPPDVRDWPVCGTCGQVVCNDCWEARLTEHGIGVAVEPSEVSLTYDTTARRLHSIAQQTCGLRECVVLHAAVVMLQEDQS